MALLFRRSILEKLCLNKFYIVVSCLAICVFAPLALAQHPLAHATGGVVHPSPSPIRHAPISAAPMIHAPVIAPRVSAAWSAGALGTASFRPPRRPIRPFPTIFILYGSSFFGGPFLGLNSCAWATCDQFWPWTFGYTTVSSPGPTNYVSQVYETPVYVYGEEGPDLPQLFLKDGTILNVTDYWVVDDQLHFTMIEEDGANPAEHAIPFDALDLQTTVDKNTRRGFRFILRNEPFEQYLRDHPEGAPPPVTPPRE
jgi:hypothetical protein